MRSMLVGPSGSGKTVLLTNMILDIYKGCFSRICIWSPSVEVDSTWKPVKGYIRCNIKPGDREKCYFDSYGPAELQVINTQRKLLITRKNRNTQICIRYSLLFVILQVTPILHESLNYYISYILEEDSTLLAKLHQHRFINKLAL